MKQCKRAPDVVRFPAQEVFPITSLPEPEAFHVLVVVAHRGVTVRRSVKVDVDQLHEVCAHDLVCVDKDDLFEVHGEQHVEEKNLVPPNDALFFLLCAQPRWPLVRNKFVLEVVRFRKVGNELLPKGSD